MFLSLFFIIVGGVLFGRMASKFDLPALVGMVLWGIILGPSVLNLLDSQLLAVSTEIRTLALVVILVKAGLTLSIRDLWRVGRPALLLSFVPASFEIAAYALFAPLCLGLSRVDAVLMGTVLAAVSPAVVVPRMVRMIEEKKGTDKGIPQMILAGASLDDIFVIVLFTSVLKMAQGSGFVWRNLWNIPLSIAFGVAGGACVGLVFSRCMLCFQNEKNLGSAVLMLGVALGLLGLETILPMPYSGLLAILSFGLAVKHWSGEGESTAMATHFGKLWTVAEVFLFVLVGAAVQISAVKDAGLNAVLLLLLALLIRSVGVQCATWRTGLSLKERLFLAMSYLPKATVQAAIGSLPLAAGLASGPIILAVAVLGILITAPLGAFFMDRTMHRICR